MKRYWLDSSYERPAPSLPLTKYYGDQAKGWISISIPKRKGRLGRFGFILWQVHCQGVQFHENLVKVALAPFYKHDDQPVNVPKLSLHSLNINSVPIEVLLERGHELRLFQRWNVIAQILQTVRTASSQPLTNYYSDQVKGWNSISIHMDILQHGRND